MRTIAKSICTVYLCLLCSLFVIPSDLHGEEGLEVAALNRTKQVDFETEILPILSANCLACHSSSEAEGDLILETPATILTGGSQGAAVVAGNAQESILFKSITHRDEPIMPPEDNEVGAKNLTPGQLALFKLWIKQGATGTVDQGSKKIHWQPLPPALHPIYSAAVTFDGAYAAAARGNQVFMYRLPDSLAVTRLTDPGLVNESLYVDGSERSARGVAHLDLVQSLAFSPDGEMLATGGFRNIKLWSKTHPSNFSARLLDGARIDGVVKVLDVATSPNGEWMATLLQDEEKYFVSILNAHTREKPHRLNVSVENVSPHKLALSNDGEKIYLSSSSPGISIWDTTSGEQLQQIPTDKAIVALCLLNNKLAVAQLAEALDDQHASLAFLPLLPTGLASASPEMSVVTGGESAQVTVLSRRGNTLLSGHKDGTIRIWDVDALKPKQKVEHTGPITALTGGGGFIAAGAQEGLLRVWNTDSGKLLYELQGDTLSNQRREQVQRLHDAAVARSKRRDETVAKAGKELEAKTKTLAKRQEEVEKATTLVAQKKEAMQGAEKEAESGEEAAKKKLKEAKKQLADAQGKLKQAKQNLADTKRDKARANNLLQQAELALADAKVLQEQQEGRLSAAQKAAAEHNIPITALHLSPDGRTLAFARNAIIYTHQASSGKPLERWSAEGNVSGLAIGSNPNSGSITNSDSKEQIIGVTVDGQIARWSGSSQWKLLRTIGSPSSTEAFEDRVLAIAFSPDGTVIATGGGRPSRGGELKLWNISDGTLLRNMPDAHSDTIFSVGFSPDGRFLATTAADRFLKLFDLSDGKHIRSFEGHTHHVLDVAWRADGEVLASTSADASMKVWNVETGDQLRTVQGFGKEVTSVAFLGTTHNTITGCGDGGVRIHNTDNGKQVRSLSGFSDFVHVVGATFDGSTAFGGGHDGVLRLWKTADGKTAGFFEPPPTPRVEDAPDKKVAKSGDAR